MNKIKLYILALPPLLVGVVALAFAIPYSPTPFLLAFLFLILLSAALVGYLVVYERKLGVELDNIFGENSAISRQIVNNMNIPCLFCDTNGRIVWRNEAFAAIFDGKSLKKLLSESDLEAKPHIIRTTLADRHYSITVMPVVRTNKRASNMLFLYFTDKTEAISYNKLYTDHLPCVAVIHVDNYEDLNAEQGFMRNAMINEVERRISEMTKTVGGVYRRLEGAKFLMMCEANRFKQLETSRFDILNSVRSIDTGTDQCATLSIGVGTEDSLAASFDAAQNAIELALGRGGDQAVVKKGANYKFYGGRNISQTKISRVRVRSIAGGLRELMLSATDIYVMGHKRPDLDCIGAGLGILRCAAAVNRHAYYVTDGGLPAVEKMLGIALPQQIAECIRTPEQAMESFRKQTSLLVIVDTQRESMFCSAELYKKAEKVVIIDHHRRSADAVSDATISYTEPASSSAGEMVTEIVQCFYERTANMSVIATAMLAGIALDTKFFAFNTGVRTFEAAAYLRQSGADMGTVKRMFQDDMETFTARSGVVEKAEILPAGIAVSLQQDGIPNAILIAAQAADTLITITGVRASFVLASANGGIFISARSLGDINVQTICEKLGGGGHLTGAGAQMRDVTPEQAKEKVLEAIEEYLKEENI